MKRLAGIVVVFLAMACGSASASETSPARGPSACDFPPEAGKPVRIGLGGGKLLGGGEAPVRWLSIPRNYLPIRAKRDGEIRSSIAIWLWRDSLLPYTLADSRLPGEKAGRRDPEGTTGDVSASLYPGRIPMGVRLENTFHVFFGMFDKRLVLDPVGIDVDFGLRGQAAHSRDKELFFRRSGDDSEITDIFLCNKPEQGRKPHCNHTFHAETGDIRMTYPRKYLETWPARRADLAKLVDCFVNFNKGLAK